jgi:hypothetical protein
MSSLPGGNSQSHYCHGALGVALEGQGSCVLRLYFRRLRRLPEKRAAAGERDRRPKFREKHNGRS